MNNVMIFTPHLATEIMGIINEPLKLWVINCISTPWVNAREQYEGKIEFLNCFCNRLKGIVSEGIVRIKQYNPFTSCFFDSSVSRNIDPSILKKANVVNS